MLILKKCLIFQIVLFLGSNLEKCIVVKVSKDRAMKISNLKNYCDFSISMSY